MEKGLVSGCIVPLLLIQPFIKSVFIEGCVVVVVVPKMRIRPSCGVESSKRIPWILWQVNPSSVFSAFYSSACLCVSLLPAVVVAVVVLMGGNLNVHPE